eukprot:scaffold22024_cov67-Isochrysis_galbana.AAC.1
MGTVFTCAVGLSTVAASLLGMGAITRLSPLGQAGVLAFWAMAGLYQVRTLHTARLLGPDIAPRPSPCNSLRASPRARPPCLQHPHSNPWPPPSPTARQ